MTFPPHVTHGDRCPIGPLQLHTWSNCVCIHCGGMAEDILCLDCGEPLDFDEVDIGGGVQRGNPRCPNCGWEPRTPEEIRADDEYFKTGARYPGQ